MAPYSIPLCRDRDPRAARIAAPASPRAATLAMTLAVTLAVTAVLFAAMLTWGVPTAASSESWGWPLDHPAPTLLGFGASYASGGQTRTHTGCDLKAERGDAVLAPVAATVSFVGQVPAGPDRRVTAVTLEDAGGAKTTLMPLVSATAKQGQHVAAGQRLGALAADGDPSIGEAHLHVSVRKGSLYVDPLGLLCAPTAAAPDATQSHPDATPEPDTAPDTADTRSDGGQSAGPGSSQVPATSAGSTYASQSSPTPASSLNLAGSVGPAVGAASSAAAATAIGSASSVAAGASHTRLVDGSPAQAHHARPASSARAGAPSAGVRTGVHMDSAVGSGRDASAGIALSSLGMLLRAARSRDRFLPLCVSYLLGTIATVGLVRFAVRRVTERSAADVAVVPVRSE